MNSKQLSKILIAVYFVNVLLFMFGSLLDIHLLKEATFVIRMPLFFVLYFLNSRKIKYIYFITLFLYQLASVFYVQEGLQMFFYGTVTSLLFKGSILLLLFPFISRDKLFAIIIASFPFFIIYLYIIQFVVESLDYTYFIWILNAFITSLIGGVAIITYLNNSSQKTFWLLISAILLLFQIGGFFLNKFYISNSAVFQIVILAYSFSQYTFYRFMILRDNEGVENNSSL